MPTNGRLSSQGPDPSLPVGSQATDIRSYRGSVRVARDSDRAVGGAFYKGASGQMAISGVPQLPEPTRGIHRARTVSTIALFSQLGHESTSLPW